MIVFADAFFFIALLNRRDDYHGSVKDYACAFQGTMVTTHRILIEVADAMAALLFTPVDPSLDRGIGIQPIHRHRRGGTINFPAGIGPLPRTSRQALVAD